MDVERYAGHRGAQTPRRFQLGERQVEIAEVVDSWLPPDHRYFKMRDTQGDLYILRNDGAADRWELTGIVKTFPVCSDAAMSLPLNRATLYKGYRFPPEIISRCVWLYYRFSVSLRDISELMLARGIEVSHEAIRLWTLRFGAEYARRLRRTRGACSNVWPR